MSAKTIFTIGISCLLIACFGFLLVMNDVVIGRYVVYISVPIGALAVFVGVVGLALGKLENDLRK
jgi:hypothetical protein